VQIKLLRALQEREFERVGGHETIKVDVRVISATNRDLETMIEDGEFREDLYYRLNVFPINLPPLRDRLEDLPLLVEHFVAKFGGRRVEGGCTPAGLEKLSSYTWPGNVRELENIIERASILARGAQIDARHLDFGRRAQTQSGSMQVLPPEAAAPGTVQAPADDDSSKPLAERLLDSEKREIIAAVDKCNNNIAGAARMLGINRSTLYYRMRKHGLEHLLPTKVTAGGTSQPAPAAEADKPAS
jgi:transcriptional regulator with GAF, ATPase, and Fis domain